MIYDENCLFKPLQKRTFRFFKHEFPHFSFFGTNFCPALIRTDPDSQSGSADPIESGSETLFFSHDCAVQVRIQKEQVKEERQKFMKKKESLQNVEIKKKSATGICKTYY